MTTRPLRFESMAMWLRKFCAGQNNHREVAIMKILIRFYYDLCASTTILLRYCHFCYDSCNFDQFDQIVAELPSSGMGVLHAF